jgi:hypothetical protein
VIKTEESVLALLVEESVGCWLREAALLLQSGELAMCSEPLTESSVGAWRCTGRLPETLAHRGIKCAAEQICAIVEGSGVARGVGSVAVNKMRSDSSLPQQIQNVFREHCVNVKDRRRQPRRCRTD